MVKVIVGFHCTDNQNQGSLVYNDIISYLITKHWDTYVAFFIDAWVIYLGGEHDLKGTHTVRLRDQRDRRATRHTEGALKGKLSGSVRVK